MIVCPAKDGWQPSVESIKRLQKKARKIGLISDWPIILALANHDLLLDCSHITGDDGEQLIARKSKRGWIFLTDGEVLRGES
jgi:hypothetical protein